MKDILEKLDERRAEARLGGGTKRIEAQHARGKLTADGTRMTEVQVIFRMLPKSSASHHFGSRLVFDRAGYLYITLGDRGDSPGKGAMQRAQGRRGGSRGRGRGAHRRAANRRELHCHTSTCNNASRSVCIVPPAAPSP